MNEFFLFLEEQAPVVDVADAVFESEFLNDVPDCAVLFQDYFDVFLIDSEQLYPDSDWLL